MVDIHAAGIRVVMITGDHKLTAEAIGREAGIFKDGNNILTGTEIDAISEEQLAKEIALTTVFARVSPEHKLKIINAFKARGEIIAMTGDGVNDASSLVAADVGVAMGKIGTEVAKEAADLVLLDDNFGNITAAVEEGRNIFLNIKKVLLYLFTGSTSLVLTILGTIIFGYPLPLVASQIIWLNFATSGILDISLGMESYKDQVLHKHYKNKQKHFFDKKMIFA
jgi:Ca2+-transporting ATPase